MMMTHEERSRIYFSYQYVNHRFHRCSVNVKSLFKTFCLCAYDTGSWKYFSATTYNKLKSAYNKCINKKCLATQDAIVQLVYFLICRFLYVGHHCS